MGFAKQEYWSGVPLPSPKQWERSLQIHRRYVPGETGLNPDLHKVSLELYLETENCSLDDAGPKNKSSTGFSKLMSLYPELSLNALFYKWPNLVQVTGHRMFLLHAQALSKATYKERTT